MNKMLLTSTFALSLIVIKAVKNGLSPNQVVELSTLSLLKTNKKVNSEVESRLLSAAKSANLTDNEVTALISTQGISPNQVKYAVRKDKLDKKTKKVRTAKAVKVKKLSFSFAPLKVSVFQAHSTAK
jgi:hypothetical protein